MKNGSKINNFLSIMKPSTLCKSLENQPAGLKERIALWPTTTHFHNVKSVS